MAALAPACGPPGLVPAGCRGPTSSLATADAPTSTGDRQAERDRLVERSLLREGIRDPRVLAALRRVPRHRFVPEAYQAEAYDNRPLPIGGGQTISQPFVVAYMTEAATPTARDRCLEVGTGSGYQAAILAEVCGATYSIEYLETVARRGEQNLRNAGYGPDRVHLRVGDGYEGWPETAPFDVIVVTAAPKHAPQPLLDQLAVGGRLLIPVGPSPLDQHLERWTRLRPGAGPDAFRVERLLAVTFVPWLGKESRP
jgi:protein-L-isoaspartate(D-aspartate) O-methyltransferase